MDLRRRDVLKLLGLSVAASAVPGCKHEAHNLVPYLLPDEEIIPGVANWYSSICRECDAGCGTMVRVMEGRAKKIEGNPEHPLNRGKLCARGQASLQALYNPDRLKTPLRRAGERGGGRFDSLAWPEAVGQVVDLLRQSPQSLLIGRARSGSESALMTEFMTAIKGAALFYSPEDTVSLRMAAQKTFGFPALPRYDVARCDYLLSLGAPFLEHWLSPVALSMGYGEMRQGRPGVRGRFIQIEPRLSLTAASADQWIPIRPGTENLLVMALAKLVFDDRRHRRNPDMNAPWADWARSLSLEGVAAMTEIPEAVIRQLADDLVHASSPLVLAGGTAAGQTNGTSALMGAFALNAMLGAINRPGGVSFIRSPRFDAGPSPVGERAVIEALHDVSEAHGVLLLHDLDLLHLIPPSFQLGTRLQSCRAVVVLNSMMDDSSLMADVILPIHTSLEAWGDHVYEGEAGRPALGLQQPVVRPLYATKAVGDLILELAAQLGGTVKARFPWPDFRTYLESRWAHRPDAATEAGTWTQYVQQGGWWADRGDGYPVRTRVLPKLEAAQFEGTAEDFPFYFYPFPSLGLHRGEGANRPWLQQLPDPLTTAVWGSWVEMNPATAQRLGLKEGDLARITSAYGRLEAPMVLAPGTYPGLIAMPMGQGHAAYGRYAALRGVNPMALLAPALDRQSGHLASGATRVRVEATGRQGRLVRLENPGADDGTQMIQIDRLRRHI